jgi:hypothetical protein
MMEQLDALLFDYLLGKFLAPQEACTLAAVSRTLKTWVDGSLVWKAWCEKDTPSIKTSPARELVEALYCSGDGSVKYKQLFLRLSGKRCVNVQAATSGTGITTGNCSKLPDLADYIMLMDVHVKGEGLLYCSADCTELERTSAGCEEDWEYDSEVGTCKAVVRGIVDPGSDLELYQAIQEVVDKVGPGQYYDARALTRLKLRKQDTVLFNWKLLRKSDGKVQKLLDREAITWKDVGSAPGIQNDDGIYHHRAEASAALKDKDGSEWGFFRVMMRLRSYFKGGNVNENHFHGIQTFEDSQGYAVEVGIVRISNFHNDPSLRLLVPG